MREPVVFHGHAGRPAKTWLSVDPRIAGRELPAGDVASTAHIAVLGIAADGAMWIAAPRTGRGHDGTGPRCLFAASRI